MEDLMTEQAQLTRHDLEAKIVKRCWEDEAFRKGFTSDPAGAFVKYLDVRAERLPKITVYQEEPGTWHIVLPSKPGNASELSEADLEKVAGGVTPVIATVSATLSIATVSGAVATATKDGGW
jgi:hypothetical protein